MVKQTRQMPRWLIGFLCLSLFLNACQVSEVPTTPSPEATAKPTMSPSTVPPQDDVGTAMTPQPPDADLQPDTHEVVFTIPVGKEGVQYEGENIPEMLTWGPTAFTVAPDGSFWIADTVGNRLFHYSPKGDALGVVSLAGQVVGIGDLEVTSSDILVLDIAAIIPKVLRLSLDGKLLASYELPKGLRLEDGLSGIALGDQGEVLVEREGGAFVSQFVDANGKIAPRPLNGYMVPHDLEGLRILGVGPDGSFYAITEKVTTKEGVIQVDQTVRHYSATGELLGLAPVPLAEQYTYVAHGLAIGPDGAVYALVTRPDRVEIQRLRFSKKLKSTVPPGGTGAEKSTEAPTMPPVEATAMRVAPPAASTPPETSTPTVPSGTPTLSLAVPLPPLLYIYGNKLLERTGNQAPQLLADLPDAGAVLDARRFNDVVFISHEQGFQQVRLADLAVRFDSSVRCGALMMKEGNQVICQMYEDDPRAEFSTGTRISLYDIESGIIRTTLYFAQMMHVVGMTADSSGLYLIPIGQEPGFGRLLVAALDSGEIKAEYEVGGGEGAFLAPNKCFIATATDELYIFDLRSQPIEHREVERVIMPNGRMGEMTKVILSVKYRRVKLPHPPSFPVALWWSSDSRALYFVLHPGYPWDELVGSYGLWRYL